MFKIQTPLTSANIPRTIRFTEEIFGVLNKISQQHNISFNTLVLQCCQYALENLEQEEKSE